MTNAERITAHVKRLLETAEEVEQMASGYLEKGALLHHEAAQYRAVAAALDAATPQTPTSTEGPGK